MKIRGFALITTRALGLAAPASAIALSNACCVAAFGGHPWADFDRRFAVVCWQNPPSFATWRREVAAAKIQGFAVDRGNYFGGVTILSAPVFDLDGLPRHALVVVGISEQLAKAKLKHLGHDIRDAARKLSRQPGST